MTHTNARLNDMMMNEKILTPSLFVGGTLGFLAGLAASIVIVANPAAPIAAAFITLPFTIVGFLAGLFAGVILGAIGIGIRALHKHFFPHGSVISDGLNRIYDFFSAINTKQLKNNKTPNSQTTIKSGLNNAPETKETATTTINTEKTRNPISRLYHCLFTQKPQSTQQTATAEIIGNDSVSNNSSISCS